MATINYAYREILCKVVYYGPGVGGKTTNLQVIYGQVEKNSRGELVSLATETDRTLYFDFLPLDLGEIKGFKVRFQLYTVPGQVQYNATRKLVLQGADGIVFVADSQVERMEDNVQSLQNLRDNLLEYNVTLEEIPYVLQLNKRDLKPVSSVEEMTAKLSVGDCPVFEAVAVQGIGVKQTLKKIMSMVLARLHEQAVASERAEAGGGTSAVAEGRRVLSAQAGALPDEALREAGVAAADPPAEAATAEELEAVPAAASAVAPQTDASTAPAAPIQGARAPKPQHEESQLVQKWLKRLPDGLVRQKCEVYWNQLRVGSAVLEMRRAANDENTTTPRFSLQIELRLLGVWKRRSATDVFASINSHCSTANGDFWIIVEKNLLGITGDLRQIPLWRLYVQDGETPFVYAVKKALGGQFLLVPEGRRLLSPE
ncbi:MAG: hypothetical protein Kow0059_17830 [Candidatus Sumerlaeia bacterium]